MQGSLGDKIGEGAVADVHVWAPGQVVKLFKRGVSRRMGVHEARMTRAAFAAGGPAPEVLGEVTVDGRFGIVLSRFDGPTLLHCSRFGALTSEQVGAILARLARALHAAPAPAQVPSLRDHLEGLLRFAGGRIPERIVAGIAPMIARLPEGEGLCHGDLHSGNVIVTADGPRLIDWTSAVRAPAVFDVAVCQIVHTEAAPHLVADPERPRAVNAAVQVEYARLAGLSPAALTAATAPFLPIVRVLALFTWPPALQERLIARIDASLRAET